MKKLIALLLLLSTPAMAQNPFAGRNNPGNPYAGVPALTVKPGTFSTGGYFFPAGSTVAFNGTFVVNDSTVDIVAIESDILILNSEVSLLSDSTVQISSDLDLYIATHSIDADAHHVPTVDTTIQVEFDAYVSDNDTSTDTLRSDNDVNTAQLATVAQDTTTLGNMQPNSQFSSTWTGTNFWTQQLVIGTDTAQSTSLLDIIGDGGSNAGVSIRNDGTTSISMRTWSDNSFISPSLFNRKGRGTEAVPTATIDNDRLYRISARGHDGTGHFSGHGATIDIYATENHAPGAQGTRIEWLTTPNLTGSASNILTFDQDGSLTVPGKVTGNGVDYNAEFEKVGVSTVSIALSTTTLGSEQDKMSVSTDTLRTDVDAKVEKSGDTMTGDLTGTGFFASTFTARVGDGVDSSTLTIAAESPAGFPTGSGGAGLYIDGKAPRASFVGYGGGNGAAINFAFAQGTNEAPTTVLNANQLGFIRFHGHDGTAFTSISAAEMRVRTAEEWAPGSHGTIFQFRTTPIGTDSKIVALTIENDGSLTTTGDTTSGGDVFVTNGSSLAVGTLFPSAKLHVQDGEIFAIHDGASPRVVVGDDAGSARGYLQWDSANDYTRVGSDGAANDLKINGNNISIGNIFPGEPLTVGFGTTNLLEINDDGNVYFQKGAVEASTLSATGLLSLASNDCDVLTPDTTGQICIDDTHGGVGESPLHVSVSTNGVPFFAEVVLAEVTQPIGELFVSTSNAIETTIATAGIFVMAEGNSSTSTVRGFVSDQSGRLTYVGLSTKTFSVNVHATISATNNNKEIHLRLVKNGDIEGAIPFSSPGFTGTGDNKVNVSTKRLFANSTTGDYWELFIANITDNVNLTLEQCYMVVTAE